MRRSIYDHAMQEIRPLVDVKVLNGSAAITQGGLLTNLKLPPVMK